MNTTKLKHNGKERTVEEWSKATMIPEETIRYRLSLWWSVEDTLTTPVLRKALWGKEGGMVPRKPTTWVKSELKELKEQLRELRAKQPPKKKKRPGRKLEDLKHDHHIVKVRKHFVVRVKLNGKKITVGRFLSMKDAKEARDYYLANLHLQY